MHKHDIDNLLANPAWRELVSTLEDAKKGLEADLVDIDPVTEAGKMARQQGRLKMLEFVLALPDDFIEEIRLEEVEKLKNLPEEENEDERRD